MIMTANPIPRRSLLAIGAAILLCCFCSCSNNEASTDKPGSANAAGEAKSSGAATESGSASKTGAADGNKADAIAAAYKAYQEKNDFRFGPYAALIEAVGSAKSAADLKGILPDDLSSLSPDAAWRLLFGQDFNPETTKKDLEERIVLTVAMATDSDVPQPKLPPQPPKTVALLRYQKKGDKGGTGQLFFYEDGMWKPHVDDLDADNLVLEDACRARGVIVKDNKVSDITGLLAEAKTAKQGD